jgi:hypothetical protein
MQRFWRNLPLLQESFFAEIASKTVSPPNHQGDGKGKQCEE